MRARSVVTGIGVVAPNGADLEDYWAATLSGRSGIAPMTRPAASSYPLRLAGEVPAFAAEDHVPGRIAVQTDRWTHLGLAASAMALADADADPAAFPEYDMAVVTASSSGGTEFGQREIQKLWSRGPRSVGAYQSIAWFYAASTGQTSIRYGMRGPCRVLATEQTGGIEALAEARRILRGGARLVLAGGTDASLCPYGIVAQFTNGQISRATVPEQAYLPFDRRADGYVPGEGGAMMVLEDLDEARRRGVTDVYGEIVGYGATFDPPPDSRRPPNLRRAIQVAFDDAGLTAGDIDVVFADAHGTPSADRLEAETLVSLFGERSVPVTAPKTMTGRLYAGGAALDVATALLSLRDQTIPPTVGIHRPAFASALDLVVDQARPATLRTALVVARGHGGFNAALIVRLILD
ncbi:act minimal PKS chain-length factor (CLF/KS beta) [Nonomuraea fuscirosea]|uniref:Act minimal PKS chain-length factor (CLF/KS beta) n=1 Tax=Nonomuraea fuscirosea TaxID=1291556 RepID=A0A2T0MXH2_9ACTN|nr:ketosynthase chain-length factor [Nonomuraea fuscirosea]PRX63771.1 act minimal PKS chain-length factor (CLF/KS beta) [Nonomuraea fuscirosea]